MRHFPRHLPPLNYDEPWSQIHHGRRLLTAGAIAVPGLAAKIPTLWDERAQKEITFDGRLAPGASSFWKVACEAATSKLEIANLSHERLMQLSKTQYFMHEVTLREWHSLGVLFNLDPLLFCDYLDVPLDFGGNETVGQCLQVARMRKGLSQTEAAARLGVAQPNYWKFEQQKNINLERLEQIAAALGCSVINLIPREKATRYFLQAGVPRVAPFMARVAKCLKENPTFKRKDLDGETLDLLGY